MLVRLGCRALNRRCVRHQYLRWNRRTTAGWLSQLPHGSTCNVNGCLFFRARTPVGPGCAAISGPGTKVTPACTGVASLTMERTRDQAPSAPMTRSASAVVPLSKARRWVPSSSRAAERRACGPSRRSRAPGRRPAECGVGRGRSRGRRPRPPRAGSRRGARRTGTRLVDLPDRPGQRIVLVPPSPTPDSGRRQLATDFPFLLNGVIWPDDMGPLGRVLF